MSEFAKGIPVISADKKETGALTGSTRRCQMEGCTGLKLGVKWPDHKTTWPCTKGMEFKDERWTIL